MPHLFVLSGPDAGRSFAVRDGSKLGRARECDVQLREGSISRRHAHIEVVDGRWFVVDDGSRNGILVDSVRRDRVELKSHGEFQLGELLLRFRLEDPAAAPVAAPAPEPAPEPPAPAAADASEEEIVLEEPQAAPPPAAARTNGAAAAAADSSHTRFVPAALEAKSRILQYHKLEHRRGAAVTDLTQYPLWVRWLAYALALALALAIAYFVFRSTTSLREGLS